MRKLLLCQLALNSLASHITADDFIPAHRTAWRRNDFKFLGTIVPIKLTVGSIAALCHHVRFVAPEHSVLREKALEHIFLSDLSKALLLDLSVPFEVLRSEFDANGYDIVVEARGIIRHIQMKVTRVGGKRRNVDINLALADKPSGCVVWMMADPATLNIGPFYWLGATPGLPLTIIDGSITRPS